MELHSNLRTAGTAPDIDSLRPGAPEDGDVIADIPEDLPDAGTPVPLHERLELRPALLYGLWVALAVAGDALDLAPLQSAAGWILAAGAALTTALFAALARLPGADQPSESTMVAAQALMGIIWSTLYLHFAGGTSLLAPGMYASAIALALPSGNLPLIRKLMVAAAVAALCVPLFGPVMASFAGAGTAALLPDSLHALLSGLAQAVLLGALYFAALGIVKKRASLEASNIGLHSTIRALERSAERDHLTRSYNRRSTFELIARERSRADRSGHDLCICLLDIDHFKDMNDRYGHLAGDRVLAAFSRRVRGALRTMDSVGLNGLKGSLGRVGGEEFIVVLPETSIRGALRSAERIRKAVVRRPFGGLHQVTVSIGIAEYRPGESVSSLVSRADKALYGAKHAGRNRVHCATADGGPSAIIMPDINAAS